MVVGLDKLPIGVPGVVMRVRRRKMLMGQLKDFGLLPGTTVTVRYRSPGGGVAVLECGESMLALRTRDLKGVRVKWNERGKS